MNFFLDSALLGVQYSLLAVGIYISYRIMNTPDLTVDGSFIFGMATSSILTLAGHPFLGLFLGLLAGALAGVVTGFLQTVAGIPSILAGILTMTGLYTVNITVLNAPNVSLIRSQKFYDYLADYFNVSKDVVKLLFAPLIAAFCILLLALFFKTVLGLCIRATGNNEDMVRASSIPTTMTRIVALAVSNAMIGLCGGIVAQYQGYADINSGSGMIVIGLASVIIGEAVFGKRSVFIGLISAAAGSVIYRLLIAVALKYNIISSDALKLLSALIVGVTLSIPTVKKAICKYRARRRNRIDA